MSSSREYTSVFPNNVQRSRDQHYSENGVSDKFIICSTYFAQKCCASSLGATGHVCAWGLQGFRRVKERKDYTSQEAACIKDRFPN
eukprot:1161256-Pelagomonas_calceolata.AAC.1